MFSTHRKALVMALAGLFMGAVLGLVVDQALAASSRKLTGTVAHVDVRSGLLALRATDGTLVKMAAPAMLLKDLRVGEHVAIAVRKTGGVGERQRVATGERQRAATVAATVENVDQHSKSLTIRTINHEIVELQAPAGLLDRLQAGDRVEVVIRKQDRAE